MDHILMKPFRRLAAVGMEDLRETPRDTIVTSTFTSTTEVILTQTTSRSMFLLCSPCRVPNYLDSYMRWITTADEPPPP